ncbi:MAG: type II toxin-antitoxin system VapC family toxin [Nanoarchaeota archaeon]
MLILDTSIIIELEKENKVFIAKLEELKKQERSLPKISFITYFEILEGIENKSEKNKEKAKAFVELFEVLQTTKITAEKLVYLRKNYELPIPDLIIAAQTLENNGTLITKDKDFNQIKEINKIRLF